MKKSKMHRLDKIMLGGMGVIGLIGPLLDFVIIRKVNFPVYSIASVYASYGLWIILLIYSLLKCKGEPEKPQFVRWYIGFVIPYMHIVFVIFGFVIAIILAKLLNL